MMLPKFRLNKMNKIDPTNKLKHKIINNNNNNNKPTHSQPMFAHTRIWQHPEYTSEYLHERKMKGLLFIWVKRVGK